MVAFVANLKSVIQDFELAKARLEHKVTVRKQDIIRDMLADLAANTPQWSGDLAASWEVLVGAKSFSHGLPTTIFKSVPFEVPPPYIRGDLAAVGYARVANEEKIKTIRWNSLVSIVNISKTLQEGDEGNNPLTQQVADINIQKRPQNYIPGDFMAVHYVAQKYQNGSVSMGGFEHGS